MTSTCLTSWPLDNLYTVGGGVMYAFNQKRTLLALHVGMNRLDDFVPVPAGARFPSRRLPKR